MILSIVIPTLNRAPLLSLLLLRLKREMLWLPGDIRSQVEVVVGDNASDDGTVGAATLCSGQSWFRFKKFDERVGADDSISRTVELGQGRFIWVFGDDDSLSDGFLRPVVELLIAKPDFSLYYFNRLVLDSQFKKVIRIAHTNWNGDSEEIALGEFIKRFTHWPGFITSIVFPRATFLAGSAYALPRYAGWTQLARIFFGASTGGVYIINYPSVAQRLGVHLWKQEWPRYWLVSMPTLLGDLEEAGITNGAVKAWRESEVSYYRLAADALVAKAYGIECTDEFWENSTRRQAGGRRWVLIAARYTLPCFLAKIIYRFLQAKYR